MRTAYGTRIASVIHLAAYFDLTGEPNPLYSEITVHGTEKLLRALQSFEVEQFVLASYSRWRRGAILGVVRSHYSEFRFCDLPFAQGLSHRDLDTIRIRSANCI